MTTLASLASREEIAVAVQALAAKHPEIRSADLVRIQMDVEARYDSDFALGDQVYLRMVWAAGTVADWFGQFASFNGPVLARKVKQRERSAMRASTQVHDFGSRWIEVTITNRTPGTFATLRANRAGLYAMRRIARSIGRLEPMAYCGL